MKKTLDRLTYLAFALLSVIILVAFLAPDLLGITFHAILGESMTPFLNPGDVVALNERAGPEEIQIGDVIAFQVEGVDTPMTHRVAAISNGAEEITFRTRGDASREVDPWTVKPDQVLGRVIYSVPQLGYLTRLSRTPEGFALLVLLPAVAVLVLAVRDLARRPYSSGDRMGDHQERGLQPASGGFKGKASTTALSKGDRRLP